MSGITNLLKTVYRQVIPQSIRYSPAATKIKLKLFGHDSVYNAGYYAHTVEGAAVRSAQIIAETISRELKPTTAVDVGCGTGALLEALRTNGAEVFGLEYSDAALEYCRSRRLNVTKFDLEKDSFETGKKFDVAISTEVAEHLPANVAERYVDLLCRLSNTIVFTAAPPGQGGADHVNEQPPEYWISKFERRGFKYCVEMSKRWRGTWASSGEVEGWYHQNLMIFQR